MKANQYGSYSEAEQAILKNEADFALIEHRGDKIWQSVLMRNNEEKMENARTLLKNANEGAISVLDNEMIRVLIQISADKIFTTLTNKGDKGGN